MAGPLDVASSALGLAAALAQAFAADPEVRRAAKLGRWARRLTKAALDLDDVRTEEARERLLSRIVGYRIKLGKLEPSTLATVDAVLQSHGVNLSHQQQEHSCPRP